MWLLRCLSQSLLLLLLFGTGGVGACEQAVTNHSMEEQRALANGQMLPDWPTGRRMTASGRSGRHVVRGAARRRGAWIGGAGGRRKGLGDAASAGALGRGEVVEPTNQN